MAIAGVWEKFRGQVVSPLQVCGKKFRGYWAELGKSLGDRGKKFRGQTVSPVAIAGVWEQV